MGDRIDKFLTTRIIHHGPGALERLGAEIARLGAARVGVVVDQGVAAAGILERVLGQIKGGKDGASVFDQAQPEPRYALAHVCAHFLRESSCDLVVGVGGGSAMDLAKMAAALVGNSGGVPDYFGRDRLPRPGLPVIAIPTTAGTGSEVTPVAVFVDPADQSKKAVRSDWLLPEVAIVDPLLTLSLPQGPTASTGMDALTHAIEAYTGPAATLLSDVAAERAIELIARHLRTAYANGQDLEARHGMAMGSLLAGIALAIAGTGAVHALAHVMGGMHHVSHGVANAMLLPEVMAFNRVGCGEKYARVAALMGESVEGLSLDAAARRAAEAVRRLSQDVGIPQRLSDVGVGQDALPAIAERCLQTQGRILANNPRAVSLEEATAILRRVC